MALPLVAGPPRVPAPNALNVTPPQENPVMVAIIVSQPQDTASTPAPAWPRRVVTPGPGGVAGRPGAAALADVTPLRPRTVGRPLPDRSTRIRRRRLVALLMAVAPVAAPVVTGPAGPSTFWAVGPPAPPPGGVT